MAKESNDTEVEVPLNTSWTSRLKTRTVTKFDNLKTFVFNYEEKSVLGRTGRSWGLISMYYAGFYTFLFAYFAVIFAIYYAFLSKHLPHYYNVRSVMDYVGVNPGMGFRPNDPDSPGIIKLGSAPQNDAAFNAYKQFATDYLVQNFSLEGADQFKKSDCLENYATPLPEGYSCVYNWDSLITPENECSFQSGAGYATGEPCVIIKLNRIVGWNPSGNLSVLPPNINVDSGFVYFRCMGSRAADNDNFEVATYYSMGTPDGNNNYAKIPFSYFPYFNARNYVPAFAVVKFRNITPNTIVNVACLAYADNIDHSPLS
ncbi:hypothetical protein ACOME3_005492 [Neoechinorhynchus agilis]